MAALQLCDCLTTLLRGLLSCLLAESKFSDGRLLLVLLLDELSLQAGNCNRAKSLGCIAALWLPHSIGMGAFIWTLVIHASAC